MWKLVDQHDNVVGLMVIYVDDMLVAAEDGNLQEAFGALKKSWNCSPEEYVNKEQSMRFCGYEIVELETGQVHIGQGSYTRDLLERHGIQGVEKTRFRQSWIKKMGIQSTIQGGEDGATSDWRVTMVGGAKSPRPCLRCRCARTTDSPSSWICQPTGEPYDALHQ